MADQEKIKAEPDVDGPSPMLTEDDVYEDAGDLEFYDPSIPFDPYGAMYLARVPPYVWEAWSKLDDDAEIQIGTIRQWADPPLDGGPGKVRPPAAGDGDLNGGDWD